MALTLNKIILPAIVANAHSSGLITAESSSIVAVYQISRYWRELFQKATRHRSDALPGWNEKEHAAANVIISALLFLAMEQCRNVERLLAQAIGIEAGTCDTPRKKNTAENAEIKRELQKVTTLKDTITGLRDENRSLRKRVEAQANEIKTLRRQLDNIRRESRNTQNQVTDEK